jgi:O-antigen ligase
MFGDNNDFALAISRIIIPLFVVSLLSEARWVRAGYRMAAPLALAGLVATYSRGGFLAVSGSTLAYLMLSRRRLIGVAAVVLGLAVLQIRAVLQTYVERLSTIAADDEERDASAESRLHFWRVAVRMASDHPLGVGLKNYPYEYDRYDDTDGLYGTQRAVHSSHFEVLAETGWVGMAFWLSLNGGALLILYRIRRRALQSAGSDENARFYVTMANGLLASHVAFLIGGAFLAQVLNELNWTTFAFVAVLHRLSARELVRVPAPQQQRTPAPPPRPRPRLRMPA